MNFILILVVSFFQLVFSKRISELKCEEYSRIETTSDRKYPHLVYLTIGLPTGTIYGDLGTLLSRRFVATSSHTYDLIPSRTKVYFTSNDQYNVISKHLHPYLNYNSTYAVAFLKLDRSVKLDAFHRPACLWQKDYFYESFASTMKWSGNSFAPETSDWTRNSIESTELIILRDSDCAALNHLLGSAFICLQPRDTDNAKYWPTHGTPIQIEIALGSLPHNYYMIGQYLFYYDIPFHKIIGLKMEKYLDWLDNLLWEDEISTCGKRFLQPTTLITYGQPSIQGEFPWHAAILRKEGVGIRKYICGGTLLNQNTVVTAAHCVYKHGGVISPQLLIVSLGKHDLDETTLNSRETGVYQIMVHEEYDPVYVEPDISLLKLKTLLDYSEFIQPICITNNLTMFDSNIGVVAGWGKNEHQQQQTILTKAALPIHSHSVCRRSNRPFFETFLNENNFCAGYANGTSVCSGDSGSGLVQESDNQFYIRGIVSLGVSVLNDTRCDTTQYVIFTDVLKLYNWLIAKI